jgi:hypothetical protein
VVDFVWENGVIHSLKNKSLRNPSQSYAVMVALDATIHACLQAVIGRKSAAPYAMFTLSPSGPSALARSIRKTKVRTSF